ncbi:MAG: histidinol-phosphate transaminase [Anaerolineales bacterium]|nr:histidinol-phosphate transaminase [Anaerolineales bacterium]
MQLPSHIHNLPAYTPIEPFEILSTRYGRRPEEIVKLDANENPYGISPRVRRALAEMDFAHIYPDPESRLLRQCLVDFSGVPQEYVLPGSGADELIDLILRVVLQPGEAVLNCPPTFGMYAFDTLLNAGRLVEVPRRPDFSLDLDAVQEAASREAVRVLFLAAPNNPDGSLLPAEVVEALLDLPILVVLDEAYIEFADESDQLGRGLSRISQVPARENLVVLRTFSKWAGLAGLRIGYGAFPAWLMPALWKAKQPYNVNVAASVAAMAAIQDQDFLREQVRTLRRERERLWLGLAAISWLQPYPSRSNFVLCQVTGRDAARLKADLAQQYGILIRYFDRPGLRDHIRVSVGKPEHTDALLQALKAI